MTVQDVDKKTNHQILRFDGRNSFLEVMDSAFEIGKVMFNFIQYDMSKPQGERYTNTITIYMDIDEFETLAHDIKIRYIDRAAMKAREVQKQGGYKYCKEIYLDLGGTPRETLARRDKSREDGKDESRQFKIVPGDKMPWIIQAEKGAGKKLETGLIAPDGMPDTRIMIPLTDKDFRKLAIVVSNEIQAWRTAERIMAASEENMNTLKQIISQTSYTIGRIYAMVERIGIRLFNKAS